MSELVRDYTADMERIMRPAPLFRLFRYDESKIRTWTDHLINDKFHASTEERNVGIILKKIEWLLFGDSLNLIYEIGDCAGFLSFYGIVPGHKAQMAWAMWDWDLFGHTGVRQAKSVIDFIMDTFNLIRVGTRTADERVVKLAKMLGFQVEGKHIQDFRWEGETYDSYALCRIKEA